MRGAKASGEGRARVQTQRRQRRDESISSVGSEEDEADGGVGGGESEEDDDDESDDDETGAERRLRLAEQYLQNIKGEVHEVGFDAEEIDKDLIAERLQEDVVCEYYTVYLIIAPSLLLCQFFLK